MGRVGEQPILADLGGEAERLEPDEQVLLDAGQGEDGAVSGELIPERLHGLQRGEVDLHVGLDVQHEPAGRDTGPPQAHGGGSPGRWRRTAARHSGTRPGLGWSVPAGSCASAASRPGHLVRLRRCRDTCAAAPDPPNLPDLVLEVLQVLGEVLLARPPARTRPVLRAVPGLWPGPGGGPYPYHQRCQGPSYFDAKRPPRGRARVRAVGGPPKEGTYSPSEPTGLRRPSWPLTCNVPSMAPRRREAFWRLITDRLSAPPPIGQRQAGTTATLTWSRYCRSKHMTQFWHPTPADPRGRVRHHRTR